MPAELERPERLQIMLTAEELAAVDDFRFQKRMPSRAAAVRELMKRGLGAEGFTLAAAGERSTNFGVLDASAPESRKGSRARGNGERNVEHGDEHER
ncbi:MAG TPA: hypothetical protein VN802_13860 [Stellaceae bacterium]|nr:hypothetical protein [Stellaceae bacterium]